MSVIDFFGSYSVSGHLGSHLSTLSKQSWQHFCAL